MRFEFKISSRKPRCITNPAWYKVWLHSYSKYIRHRGFMLCFMPGYENPAETLRLFTHTMSQRGFPRMRFELKINFPETPMHGRTLHNTKPDFIFLVSISGIGVSCLASCPAMQPRLDTK